MAEKKDSFALLRRMTSELDKAFEAPFGAGFPWPSFRGFELPERVNWAPEIDVFERDNRLITKIDLPGMKKEDVTIEVTEDQLVIRGERKHEKEEKKEGYVRTERSYGTFYRTVPLPEGVKSELAKATMHDGVLEITMPMTKVEEKSRKLEITEPVPATTVKAA